MYVYYRLYVWLCVIYNVYYDVYYCGFMFRLFDGVVWHVLCYVNMILYCVCVWFVWSGRMWSCLQLCASCLVCPDDFITSRWFINVVLNTIYYEQFMNNICMIYVLFMDRLWIYNSEWIMNIMYRLCIKYEQIMNK